MKTNIYVCNTKQLSDSGPLLPPEMRFDSPSTNAFAAPPYNNTQEEGKIARQAGYQAPTGPGESPLVPPALFDERDSD